MKQTTMLTQFLSLALGVAQALAFRHLRACGVAGQNQRLGHFGQGQLAAEQGGTGSDRAIIKSGSTRLLQSVRCARLAGAGTPPA